MLFNVPTLLLSFLLLVRATPVEVQVESRGVIPAATSVESVQISSLSIPTVETLSVSAQSSPKLAITPAGTISTAGHPGFQALAAAKYADSFVICKNKGCNGPCWAYPLSKLHAGVCYKPTHTYKSAFFHQASNKGLKYTIYPAHGGYCANKVRLSKVNTCYNLPATESQFYRSY